MSVKLLQFYSAVIICNYQPVAICQGWVLQISSDGEYLMLCAKILAWERSHNIMTFRCKWPILGDWYMTVGLDHFIYCL